VQVRYPIPTRISIESTLTLVKNFILIPSGGEHPTAVAHAVFKTMSERFGLYDDVKRLKATASDAVTGQIADIRML